VGYLTGGDGSLALGDVLGGSIGNDTINSKATAQPDFVFTQGGSDTINLAAGHTGADHVAFYAGAGNVNVGGAYAVGDAAHALSRLPAASSLIRAFGVLLLEVHQRISTSSSQVLSSVVVRAQTTRRSMASCPHKTSSTSV
jgi:hypothetical protein